jgi:hypothetical protein
MDWHEAYLKQARSEYVVLQWLTRMNREYCHRLHYLQMVTEKLGKAMVTPAGGTEPAPVSHVIFVRMLQVLKTRPEVRRRLGYRDAAVFKEFIDSLLELAGRIERLSPDQAGLTQPNPEYPWKDAATGDILAPTDYAFADFNPRDPKMMKIDHLINDLLRIAA